MNKNFLFLSSSVAALVAGSATTAQTTDVAPVGFTLSVEGGMLTGPSRWDDKSGELPPDIEKVGDEAERGYTGAVKMVRQSNSAWDFGVGFRSTVMTENSVKVGESGGGDKAGTTTDFAAQTLDFERGFRPAVGSSANLRVFSGLRLAHTTATEDKVGYFSGGDFTVDIDADSRFLGAGVRVGAEFDKQFNGSNFGMSGLIAGSALRGHVRTNTDIEACSGGVCMGASGSFEDSSTVYDLEAQLGVDYHMGEVGKVTLGYQAQQFWNVFGGEDGPGGGLDSDILMHGPFVKYTTSF